MGAENLSIEFINEEGMDAGGITREWFSVVTYELFNPAIGMFTQTWDGSNKYKPDTPADSVHPLSFFRFAGLILAKAILLKHPVPAHFSKSFYRFMLGGIDSSVVFSDYDDESPDHY